MTFELITSKNDFDQSLIHLNNIDFETTIDIAIDVYAMRLKFNNVESIREQLHEQIRRELSKQNHRVMKTKYVMFMMHDYIRQLKIEQRRYEIDD